MARRWRTMASCLRATVVNSPPPPVASPSTASRGEPRERHPAPAPPPLTHTHCCAEVWSDGRRFLRGCYRARPQRTRADVYDRSFRQSSAGLIFYQGPRCCHQGVVGLREPIRGGVALPGRVACFIARATRRQTIALKLPSRDNKDSSISLMPCVFGP